MQIIKPDGSFVKPPAEPQPIKLASRKCRLCNAWIAVGEQDCNCSWCGTCKAWKPTHICSDDPHSWLRIAPPDADTSPEVEDEVYAFAGYRFLPSRKENKNSMDRFHVILKTTGADEDINFFHFLLGSIDKDYHFRPDLPEQKIEICQRCKGFVWDRALLGPSELRRAGKQCSVEVKVQKWKKSHKCRGQVSEMTMEKVMA